MKQYLDARVNKEDNNPTKGIELFHSTKGKNIA